MKVEIVTAIVSESLYGVLIRLHLCDIGCTLFCRLAVKWSDDMDVKQLSFPNLICMQALLLLIKSTRAMPVHQTALDGFMVGFLQFG